MSKDNHKHKRIELTDDPNIEHVISRGISFDGKENNRQRSKSLANLGKFNRGD